MVRFWDFSEPLRLFLVTVVSFEHRECHSGLFGKYYGVLFCSQYAMEQPVGYQSIKVQGDKDTKEAAQAKEGTQITESHP